MTNTATRNRSRKTLTDEERAARRAADREFAQQAVEALRTSEGWQRWLRVRATSGLSRLSFRNQLLVALQMPDATRVAGFRAWLNLGYCVRRGEKAIRIFAPCPPSKAKLEAWRKAGANPTDKPKTYFKLTAVFDRSQVEELPPPAEPAPLDPPVVVVAGEDLAAQLAPLSTFAESIGSTVAFEEIPGAAHGYYELAPRPSSSTANCRRTARSGHSCTRSRTR